MSEKEMQRFRHYEALMKKSRKAAGGEKPPSCAKCQYYQPDFRYRSCLFSSCPYGKDRNTSFRKKPLRKEKIIGKEVGGMDA